MSETTTQVFAIAALGASVTSFVWSYVLFQESSKKLEELATNACELVLSNIRREIARDTQPKKTAPPALPPVTKRRGRPKKTVE